MQGTAITNGYLKTRYSVFKWRYSLSLVNKIALALGIACVTGLLAQVKAFLPWTPVPITGQTFAVLMAGVLLGGWWGGISQALYVSIGAAGFPWFAVTGGLAGPSGGYLIGFILAALFIGHFTDKYIRARNFFPMFGLMLFANFILIYVPGLIQLGVWYHLAKGTWLGLWQLVSMGALPFIIGDMAKIGIAAGITKAVTPKEAYNGEADAPKPIGKVK